MINLIKAAYLHIPFCEHICHYCDFNKVYLQRQPVKDYLQALDKEMELTLGKHLPNELKTIFVGGGTPTALDLEQTELFLESIKRHLLPYTPDELEYTFEANPSDLPKEKLDLLKSYGVNRLSLGVQAFQDSLLERIGRTHKAKDVFKTVQLAKEVGFENISIDLMYGLPGQTVDDFKESLAIAFDLGIQHVSSYSLQIEPKTVFYNQMQKGKLNLPEHDSEANMYQILLEEMDQNNYFQYEISNFSIKGYESKHNLTYWNNEEYFGFGAGAHSYVNGIRNGNIGPLNKYISSLNSGMLPYLETHKVTQEEAMEEELFLGLRKREGVSRQKFKNRYRYDLLEIFKTAVEEQREKGLIEVTEDSIRLTYKGLFLGNEVFQAFIGVTPE